MINLSTPETSAQKFSNSLPEDRHDIASCDDPRQFDQSFRATDVNIVVGAVHRGVVRPASGFVERDSERLNGCSIKDGVRRLIDISLACRDRYCDTFSSDGFGDFENRYSITGCSDSFSTV